jgi:hypothetical protein
MAAPAAASTFKPSRTLAVGMAFTNAKYEAQSAKAAAGTTRAPLRDRLRLLALSKAGHDIVSLNLDIPPSDGELNAARESRHVMGSISTGVVRDLAGVDERSASDRPTPPARAFGAVFLDYFRFPSTYLREFVRPFVTSMLPEMINRQLLLPKRSVVVVPNCQSNDVQLDAASHGLIDTLAALTLGYPHHVAAHQRKRVYLLYAPLRAEEYELYKVTNTVDKAALGDFPQAHLKCGLRPVRRVRQGRC